MLPYLLRLHRYGNFFTESGRIDYFFASPNENEYKLKWILEYGILNIGIRGENIIKRGIPMSQKELQNALIVLYEKTRKSAEKFHKRTYHTEIEQLKEEEQELLELVKEQIEDSEESMQGVAACVPEYVSELLAEIHSRRKREQSAIEYNMAMAAFFVPLMGEIHSPKTKAFTEAIVSRWNQNMPENKIGHSTVADIEQGFRKGMLCYITTAVCKSLGQPDDCYELTLLRDYRDGYLLKTQEGAALVQEYYDIAPTIVKRIDHQKDAAEIYGRIWEKYLKPCVHLIEAGRQEACRELYTEMVRSLEQQYLYSTGGEKHE